MEQDKFDPQKEDQLSLLLREGLERLDEQVPVFTPDRRWFEAQVEEHRRTIRRRWIRDLSLFVVVALAVLGSLSALVLKEPLYLVPVQAVSFLMLIPAFVLYRGRKRVKE